MARYFFDIHDGQTLTRDPVGSECDGREAVRHKAMKTLPLIAKEALPAHGDRQTFTVVVRGEDNVTVYTATLSFDGLWLGDVPIPKPEEDPLRLA